MDWKKPPDTSLADDQRGILAYVLAIVLGAALLTSVIAMGTIAPQSQSETQSDNSLNSVESGVNSGLDETNRIMIENNEDTHQLNLGGSATVEWNNLNEVGRRNLGSLLYSLEQQQTVSGEITRVKPSGAEGVDDGAFIQQWDTGTYTTQTTYTTYEDVTHNHQYPETHTDTRTVPDYEYHEEVTTTSTQEVVKYHQVNYNKYATSDSLAECTQADKCESNRDVSNVHSSSVTRCHAATSCDPHEHEDTYSQYHHTHTQTEQQKDYYHTKTRPSGTHWHTIYIECHGTEFQGQCYGDLHTHDWPHGHETTYHEEWHYETVETGSSTHHHDSNSCGWTCTYHSHTDVTTYYHLEFVETTYDLYNKNTLHSFCLTQHRGCSTHTHTESTTTTSTEHRNSNCAGCTRHQHGTRTESYTYDHTHDNYETHENYREITNTRTETVNGGSYSMDGQSSFTAMTGVSEYRDSYLTIEDSGLEENASKAFTINADSWNMKVYKNDDGNIQVQTSDGFTKEYTASNIRIDPTANTINGNSPAGFDFAGSQETHTLSFTNADHAYGHYKLVSDGALDESSVSSGEEDTTNAQAAVTAANDIVYSADLDVTYESGDTEITKRIYLEPSTEVDDPTA